MNFRKDFPIFTKQPDLVYLDSAATSQKPQVVLNAINDYYENYCSNIHRGLYPIAEKASAKVEEVRKKIAKFINASPEEIIFTKNATEAINLVAYTWGDKNITRGDGVTVSITEHHANFVPWQQLCLRKNAKFSVLDIDTAFQLNQTQSDAKLIAIPYVSNMLGTINPVKKIIQQSKAQRKEVKILIDASQASMHFPLNVKDLQCDFLVFTGHKMFAETGVGVLYAKKEILDAMSAFLYGGDMIETVSLTESTFSSAPRKFEGGTQNISGIISLGAAVDYINEKGFTNIQNHERELTRYCLEQLQKISGITIYGSENIENRIGVIAFNLSGIHAHDVAQVLANENICIRAGHHCAMPLHTRLGITASSRVSLSVYNTLEDIDRLMKGLFKVKTTFK